MVDVSMQQLNQEESSAVFMEPGMNGQEVRYFNGQNGMVITKSNQLIQKTHYDLSLMEQKIVLRLIAMIDPRSDKELPMFELSIREFAELCDMDKYSGTNRKNIRESIQSCASKTFWITPDGTKKQILVHWLRDAVIDERNDKIKLGLDPMLSPYLTQLKSFFTEYNIEYILRMHSQYSIRFYELCKSYENLFYPTNGKPPIPYKDFQVDEIKEMFSDRPLTDDEKRKMSASEIRKHTPLKEKYKNFSDFKKWVLDAAQREINLYTDLNVEFIPIKSGHSGRKIDIIRIIIHRKPQNEMDKVLSKAKSSKTTTAAAMQIRAVDDKTDVRVMPSINTKTATIGYSTAAMPESMFEALCIRADYDVISQDMDPQLKELLGVIISRLAELAKANSKTPNNIDGANATVVEQINDIIMEYHGMTDWFLAILGKYNHAIYNRNNGSGEQRVANIEGYIITCLKSDLVHYHEIVETYRKQVKRVTLKTGTWSDGYTGYKPVIPGKAEEDQNDLLGRSVRRPLRMKQNEDPSEIIDIGTFEEK